MEAREEPFDLLEVARGGFAGGPFRDISYGPACQISGWACSPAKHSGIAQEEGPFFFSLSLKGSSQGSGKVLTFTRPSVQKKSSKHSRVRTMEKGSGQERDVRGFWFNGDGAREEGGDTMTLAENWGEVLGLGQGGGGRLSISF